MKIALLTCMLCFLLSCSPRSAIEDTLNDMHERLVSFTGINNTLEITTTQLSAPSKQQFKLNIEEVLINLREFYALDECQLTKLVAERNTALGKTQLPSVRFAYEKALLTALQECVDQVGPSHRMHDKLTEWLMIKQHNLPLAYANFITQSDESYKAITLPSGFITGDHKDSFAESALAINALVKAPDALVVDLNALENHLKLIGNTRLIANMWSTQSLFIDALPQITSLLKTYQQLNTCDTRAQRDEIKIMQNIFKLFFADKVQPLASQLNKYQYRIGPLLNKLIDMPHFPANYVAYVSMHNNEQHERYRQVMSEHIKEWQNIFRLCD